MASGTSRWGWRASPARSMAVRKPSRLNRMPPAPMAPTTPLAATPLAATPLPAAPATAVAAPTRGVPRLLQWPAESIRVSDTSSGTTSFQAVSPSIQRASQVTPARLIQAIASSSSAATTRPAPLSTWPAPPSAVSQGRLLARYWSMASTSIVGRLT